jgi:hypothetical protein
MGCRSHVQRFKEIAFGAKQLSVTIRKNSPAGGVGAVRHSGSNPLERATVQPKRSIDQPVGAFVPIALNHLQMEVP